MILSYGLWQGVFAGDGGVLGRKVLLDGVPYTVIGVMPKNCYFPSRRAQLWTALRFPPQTYQDRNDNFVNGIAWLKPGASLAQARAEMNGIAGQLQRAYPKELAQVGVTIEPLRDDSISDRSRTILVVLMGASLCVLLVACTNLANLLLARALARRKELAVRTAMGAGRERVVRQLLTESVTLAVIGGALGVVLATTSLPLLVRLIPLSMPIAEMPAIDVRVLLFAALVTCGTGIGFGVIPALRITGKDGSDGLRESARSGGGRREELRSALVIAEIALSMVLLVSCGLLIRALWRIQSVDPGFRADNVLTMRTSLPMPRYERRPAREHFYARRDAILGLVLRDGLRMAAAGIAIGAVLAYIAGQELRSLLAGVPAADGLTYAAAIAVCTIMTLAGSLAPAVRALGVDPVQAIRGE